jgi:hypothetical protein
MSEIYKYGALLVGAYLLIISLRSQSKTDKIKGEKMASDGLANPEHPLTGKYAKTQRKRALLTKKTTGKTPVFDSLKPEALERRAVDVYKSKGFFKDNEPLALTALNVDSKYIVSRIAETFERIYKKDMFVYLRSFLDAENMKVLLSRIEKLPA